MSAALLCYRRERRGDWRVYTRTLSGGCGECLHLATTRRGCVAFIRKHKENQ